MTAEVAVMNKLGVAIAADSAATIANTKVLSATKIFEFPDRKPVGIMIYGSASLLGVPWAVVIDSYRRQFDSRSLSSLEDAVNDFLEFLRGNDELFPEKLKTAYVEDTVSWIYDLIADEVRERVRMKFESGANELAVADGEEILRSICDSVKKTWSNSEMMDLQSGDIAEALIAEYSELFSACAKSSFEKLAIPEEVGETLSEIAVLVLTKIPPWPFDTVTGIVMAGFGDDDLFPSCREVVIDGVAGSDLVAWSKSANAVEHGNDAFLGAFAQREMVQRFMEGVDPSYQHEILDAFNEVLDGFEKEIENLYTSSLEKAAKDRLREAKETLLESLSDEMHDYRHAAFVSDVLDVIQNQPLDQLADVAESLVSLTSFKRRVSMQTESVGGPVDVAVISRGDGLVWIKRKQYFLHDLNPHFVP